MKTEGEIKAELDRRDEQFAKKYNTQTLDEAKERIGWLEALRWVLE